MKGIENIEEGFLGFLKGVVVMCLRNQVVQGLPAAFGHVRKVSCYLLHEAFPEKTREIRLFWVLLLFYGIDVIVECYDAQETFFCVIITIQDGQPIE